MFRYRHTETHASFSLAPIILAGAVGICIIVAFMAILPIIIIMGEVILGGIGLAALAIIGRGTMIVLDKMGGTNHGRMAKTLEGNTPLPSITAPAETIANGAEIHEITDAKGATQYVTGPMVRHRQPRI